MNRGKLYQYSPDSEQEAQLVYHNIEKQMFWRNIMIWQRRGHYGSEGTFYRIAKRHYCIGIRKDVADCLKNCSECRHYKAPNQKLSGLLQTPVYARQTINLSLGSSSWSTIWWKMDFYCTRPCNKMGRIFSFKGSKNQRMCHNSFGSCPWIWVTLKNNQW